MRNIIAFIVLVIVSTFVVSHGHKLVLEKEVELEMAEAFEGLGHFEFLEEFEEQHAKEKPSPKRLACSCTFKKANMQTGGTSFIEESNRRSNIRGFPSRTYRNLRTNN
jgi:hypothetical protein